MARFSRMASIADLRERARQRLPAFAFTYIDEGAGEGRGVLRNETSFAKAVFRIRRLRPAPVSTTVDLFGRTYNQPFGVAPVGLANLAWPGTDKGLARLAEAEQVPYVLSTAATTDVETIVKVAPTMTWFQLYPSRDDAITDSLIQRAWDAGVRVLVLTVDVPASPLRNRSVRGAVNVPFRLTPRVIADLVFHPNWALSTLVNGAGPKLAMYAPYLKQTNVQYAGRMMGRLNKHGLQWADVDRVRDKWKGKLVVKGIVGAADAVAASAAGADAIWVSNHGGRQIESAPATFDVFADVRAAVDPQIPLFFDGGVRSGEDVVKACALGARVVFCGRSFIYGAAAGGGEGSAVAFNILKKEVLNTLAQMGAGSVAELSAADLVLAAEGRGA